MDSPAFFREGIAEALCCIQPFGFLHMQVMPCHIDLRMTGNILDGFDIYTQHLHHGNKGMTAAMWCQYADTLYISNRQLELLCKVRRVTRHIRFAHFPDKLLISVP